MRREDIKQGMVVYANTTTFCGAFTIEKGARGTVIIAQQKPGYPILVDFGPGIRRVHCIPGDLDLCPGEIPDEPIGN